MAVPLLVAGVLIARYRRAPGWRPFLPGVAATCLGLAAVVAAYIWVFQSTRECSGVTDVGCRLNSNQGVLTMLTLALAATAIWTTVITREMDRRRTAEELTRKAASVFSAAVDECHHNLIHVAITFTPERKLQGWPQVSLGAMAALAAAELRIHLDQGLIDQLDATCRNHESFINRPWVREFGDSPPPDFRSFVSRSLVFLLCAVRSRPGWLPDAMQSRSMRDFDTLARVPTAQFSYASSDLTDQEAAALRAEDEPLMVWWDDAKIAGIRTYEFGERFRDLAVGHVH